MTTQAPAPLSGGSAAVLERVVVEGDLSKLSPAERVTYYRAVCESLGLNPLTRPFEYTNLQGKLVLYARKDAAEQLRSLRGISCEIIDRERIEDVYVVRARATDRTGRIDESTGAVSIAGLKGDALANALMKAETKAKRRVTLSIAGLGFLDETELETIRDVRPVADEVPDAGADPAAAVAEEMRTAAQSSRPRLPLPSPSTSPVNVRPKKAEAPPAPPTLDVVPSLDELLKLAAAKGVFLKRMALEIGKDRLDQLDDNDRMQIYDQLQNLTDKPAKTGPGGA